MSKEVQEHITGSHQVLNTSWSQMVRESENRDMKDLISENDVREAVHRSINSRTKTYRYVLPTQLIAKCTKPSVDCTCLQIARGGKGAFDARSICHAVIVKFDKENDYVLGGSSEPYVNNPLRQPEVSPAYRNKQKDKRGWDDLCFVLETVEKKNNPEYTMSVFKQALLEIYRRLANIKVTYPVPHRISLARCLDLVKKFAVERSGGDRPLALASALFRTLGKQFKLYKELRRGNINAADASSRQTADIECLSEAGDILLTVEVKDQQLSIHHVTNKIQAIRARKVTEVLFIAQQGIADGEKEKLDKLLKQEFAAGQNIYIFDLNGLAHVCLALLGEPGRRLFLEYIGQELDRYHSTISDKRAWANLLAQV